MAIPAEDDRPPIVSGRANSSAGTRTQSSSGRTGQIPLAEVVAEGESLRAKRRPEVIEHWALLGIAVLVLAGSLLLSVRGRSEVVISMLNVQLPGTCTLRSVTGFPCPGCGLTRSFISIAHGEWGAAWSYNPAGFLFFLVVAFQLPYRSYCLARGPRGRHPHRFVRVNIWILLLLIASLLLQWAWKLLLFAGEHVAN